MGNGTVRRLIEAQGTTRTFEMSDGSVIERSEGSVSWRNNNPGNLKFEYSGSADKTVKTTRSREKALADARRRYEGVVDLDQWGNVIFESYEAGRAAKIHLLRRNHNDRTIEDMLQSYSRADYSGAVNHKAQAEFIYREGARHGFELHGKTIGAMTDVEIAALADGIKGFEGWRVGKTRARQTQPDLASSEAQITSASDGNVLREGIRNATVGELQTHLNNLGYTDAQGQPLAVDNHFGRNTRSALEAFQHNHGLNVDGIAGPNTWAALREAAQAQSAITAFPRMTPDLDADAIHTLQQHLNALDITDHHGRALSTTGVYDDATRAAVMNFQSAQRLPQTGMADPSTYALIEARATITKLQQITTPHAYTNDTNQRLAIMQAPLHEMQQQVEAMERQRPAEREKHDTHPSLDTRNDYVPVPQATQKLGYSDPRHPVHALYADVKQRLEAQGHHLPEDRLTQITGELHLRQFQPNWDGYIRVQGDTVHAGDYHPWGDILTLDLKEPAPSVHETVQQVDTQQQAFAQELALRAQQTQSLGHGQALSW
jgi:peptidoglycan hydrolase-like protein with peptidoglycan-binding domain